jgi:hypothetical protein
MIYKRFAANLRAQNWFAIAVELGIVILGVFIGTWVANWNQERTARAETRRMIVQLDPSLELLEQYFVSIRDYYGVTRTYAETALAGWNNDKNVSDSDFVMAAYQASQITGLITNGSAWATVLGADQLRRIDDEQLRTNLSTLISSDYSIIDLPAVDTPYRRNVRRLIPMAIQDRIRERCNDVPPPAGKFFVSLPATCEVEMTDEEAASAAAALRRNPDVRDDLQWHIAAQSAMIGNLGPFELAVREVRRGSRALN